jgi:nitrous oxide reductase accessory protein NosL
MSARGKWAFADRSQAEKFVAEAGGTLVNFENAVRAAFEDMYQDTLMIRERRKARMMNKP